jgi:hypothetical protein
VWATETTQAAPLGRTSRTLLAVGGPVLAAALATAVLSWALFTGFPPVWQVALVALVPAAIATAAVARRDRGRAIAVGIVALIVCLGVSRWMWVPEPPLMSFVQHHRAALDAVASRELAGNPGAGCHQLGPADDFGGLAKQAPADQLCIFGGDVRVDPTNGSGQLGLLYTTYGSAPSGCSAHISGRWWAVATSTSPIPGDCPHGFRFVGGG